MQIVVPPDLADILKAYTKEVIRRQPEDIYEFSAQYFSNLAAVSGSTQDLVAPTYDQLQLVYSRAKGQGKIGFEDLVGLCQQAGIPRTTVEQVQEAAASHHDSSVVDLHNALLLMLGMSATSFAQLVKGIFEVFGTHSSLDKATFLKVAGYLPSIDSSFTQVVMKDLKTSLADTATLTFSALSSNPVLRERMAVV